LNFESPKTSTSLGSPAENDLVVRLLLVLSASYPKGSVLVLKYDFVNGGHFASKVSHFQAVAKCITSMHEAGILHSDVRGFNMLHPVDGVHGGISTSRLIDFDLCGERGFDKYPPGFATSVSDNIFPRYGEAGQVLRKVHDWQELASVMAHYTPSTMIRIFLKDPPPDNPVDFPW
jgi:hypothetical protein